MVVKNTKDLFKKMNIDTHDVLATASTKWNFLPYQPGLVGGHCIGVDPYYLTYKSSLLKYNPEVITRFIIHERRHCGGCFAFVLTWRTF